MLGSGSQNQNDFSSRSLFLTVYSVTLSQDGFWCLPLSHCHIALSSVLYRSCQLVPFSSQLVERIQFFIHRMRQSLHFATLYAGLQYQQKLFRAQSFPHNLWVAPNANSVGIELLASSVRTEILRNDYQNIVYVVSFTWVTLLIINIGRVSYPGTF